MSPIGHLARVLRQKTPEPTAGAELALSFPQLQRLRDTLAVRIREALADDGRELAAKPSFLGPPSPSSRLERKPAMVVEWGGTHLRVARVAGGRVEDVISIEANDVSSSAQGLFDWQAEELGRLRGDGCRVGYIFTFPAHFAADGDATIERWGKEIDFPELVGSKVGDLLRGAAVRQGLQLGALTVLDDSVAALLAGTHRRHTSAAVIAGTGTNVSAFFSPNEAPKLRGKGWRGPMALSLETDRFSPPYSTPFDEALDRASAAPGQSRFEKLVGGRYLPELFKRILPDSPLKPATSKELADICSEGPDPERRVAQTLFDRSADLVAVSIAATAQARDSREPMIVQAEGSLFKVPGYLDRVQAQANKLTRSHPPVELDAPFENLNILGAAAAT